MDDKTWERYGALGGVGFVILAVVGGLLAGSPPNRTDSAAKIAAYYADNDTAIQTGAFLTAIGVILLLWWFGSLWRKMSVAEDGRPRLAVTALLGLTVSGIGAVTGFVINAGTAASIGTLGEGSVAFFQMSNIAYGFSAIGDVILTVAVAALIIRAGFLPVWSAYLGLVVAVVAAITSLGILSDADFFVVLGFIEFLVWALWLLVISVLMYIADGTVTAPATAVE